MDINEYSGILSALTLALGAATLLSIVGYVVLPQVRTSLHDIEYYVYIKLIGFLAITSTIGALVYQFVYLTPVCEYCWWQRIFMFPIDIIVLTTLWYKTRNNETSIAILAAIGAVFAGVHYYFHYQVIVLDRALEMPCTSIGIIPSCAESPVLVFGFVTIPLMALLAFVAILWLSFLARKVK